MPASEQPGYAPSRRANHKSKTRQALRDVALELFASQGYDATTTEEISERAGVSPRTFFRYFPTKESVVFAGSPRWVQAFSTSLLAQGSSVSDVDALFASFVESSSGLANSRKYLILYERAVLSSPTLRGRAQDNHREDAEAFAEAIAARRHLAQPDEHCKLLAAVGLMTYRRALERWLVGPANADLKDSIAAEFDMLAQLFAAADR